MSGAYLSAGLFRAEFGDARMLWNVLYRDE